MKIITHRKKFRKEFCKTCKRVTKWAHRMFKVKGFITNNDVYSECQACGNGKIISM